MRKLILAILLLLIAVPAMAQITSTAPELRFRRTDTASPPTILDQWRFIDYGGLYQLQRSATGNFATFTTPWSIDSAGNMTFTGSVTATSFSLYPGLGAKRFVYSDATGALASTAAPTNGQLLIGSTGAIPVVAGLTGTANQITVTSGAGSVTLSIPSDANLPTATTVGSAYIYRAGGTDVAVADGGTNKSSWTQYSIPYASTTTVLSEIAPAASSILVTNGSNVPSLAVDIPTAVTIGSAYIYRAGGTDVPVTDGGTGLSAISIGQLPYGSGTNTMLALAADTTDTRKFLRELSIAGVAQARLTAAQAQMENAQLKFGMFTKELEDEAGKMAGGYKFDPQKMAFVKLPEKPKEPVKTVEKK